MRQLAGNLEALGGGAGRAEKVQRRQRLMADAMQFVLDQVVWAKVKGFGWWPAQVYEASAEDTDIPIDQIPVRFLDDNSWSSVTPRECLDFVASYDQIYDSSMPTDEVLKRKFLRAVLAGRQLTSMEGWVQCENCNKWRRYPCTILGLGDGWVCQLNAWDRFKTCEMEEEQECQQADEPQNHHKPKKFGGGAPVVHPTEQPDVVYVEFETADRQFKGKVHVTVQSAPLVYVRDIFGMVWRTDDTRRLNDKYKNHKSKFEHLLQYHPMGVGKAKAVASMGDLKTLLQYFNESVAKAFIEVGELQNLERLLTQAFGLESADPPQDGKDDGEALAEHRYDGTGGSLDIPDELSSEPPEGSIKVAWTLLDWQTPDRRFGCVVRLAQHGGNVHSVALADFIAVVSRLEQSEVTKATFSLRIQLAEHIAIAQDIPLVSLTNLSKVLQLLPLYIVRQYRETGDEQQFRNQVMGDPSLTSLLAAEAESWKITGRKIAPVAPAASSSPRSSGSSAAAWINKNVRLKPGCKGFGGCVGRVESAANGYYLIRLKVCGGSVKVRSADLILLQAPPEPGVVAAAEKVDTAAAKESEVVQAATTLAAVAPPAPKAPPKSKKRGRVGRPSSSKGGAAASGTDDEAPSEELAFERGRSRCGVRVKWTQPANISAADLVCLIAGVETRREASVVVAELKERLISNESVSYLSIKGYPKQVLCVRYDAFDDFLAALPSHYMVGDDAVARFRGSDREQWLRQKLKVSGSLAKSPTAVEAAVESMLSALEVQEDALAETRGHPNRMAEMAGATAGREGEQAIPSLATAVASEEKQGERSDVGNAAAKRPRVN